MIFYGFCSNFSLNFVQKKLNETAAQGYNMRINHVFFDLDGTLTDSAEGILNSVVHALDYFNLQLPQEELISFIGPPLKDSFAPLFNNDQKMVETAIAKYREYFSHRGIFENRLYPGVTHMLQACSNAGLVLCLATSKPEPFALRILEYFKIRHFFQVAAGAELYGARSDKTAVLYYAHALAGHPQQAACLMVGDRKHDVEGAHAVGMPCCGVLYGYGSQEELIAAGVESMCATVEELQEFLLQP